MSRQEFDKPTKLAAWKRSEGYCEICTAKLFPGHIDYDHRVPDALGGEPTLENCQCICDVCHDLKTDKGDGLRPGDKTRIAKAKRSIEGHIGASNRRGQPMQGSKASRWKKKMDGSVVKR